MPSLSAEEKNSRMSQERAFLTKLLEAAVMGDSNTLTTAVNDYVSQNNGMTPVEVLTQFKDGQKRNALHFACQSMTSNNPDIVETILNDTWFPNPSLRQSILKQKDKDGLTPIMLAAQHKDHKVGQRRVLYILSKNQQEGSSSGGDLKLGLARSHAGATALHYAAGAGATPETVKALYEAGHVALNTFSLQGGTPLHWACAATADKDFTSTINALIECGANVNAQHDNIPPPLVLAVAAGNNRHAKRLLQCPDINMEDISSLELPGNLTLFHMAADLNLVGTLSMLIEKLVENNNDKKKHDILKRKNHDGLTPLDLAAQEGHVGCVLLLLQAGNNGEDETTKNVTEDDAKEFIEEYKNTHTKTMTTTPPEIAKQQQQQQQQDDAGTSHNKAGDESEEEAQRKAAEIVSSEDASKEDVQKALEFKDKGNAHFVKKEWEQAYEAYSQAIDINPKEATFYSNRSACCMNLHRPKEALADAVIARTLKPDWSKACYRMAVARLELERYEDAALAAWEGLQQDQNNDELKSLLQKCVKRGRQDYQQQSKATTTSTR